MRRKVGNSFLVEHPPSCCPSPPWQCGAMTAVCEVDGDDIVFESDGGNLSAASPGKVGGIGAWAATQASPKPPKLPRPAPPPAPIFEVEEVEAGAAAGADDESAGPKAKAKAGGRRRSTYANSDRCCLICEDPMKKLCGNNPFCKDDKREYEALRKDFRMEQQDKTFVVVSICRSHGGPSVSLGFCGSVICEMCACVYTHCAIKISEGRP